MPTRIETIAVTTHGRYLIDETPGNGPRRLLVGFHGYAQNAGEMLDELRRVGVSASGAGAPRSGWTLVSIQGLHRFYRGRSKTTVASWMTSEDRGLLIADTIAYVDAVVDRLWSGPAIDSLVYCGFSQGVAAAFRSACRGRRPVDGLIALGGDVPPELLEDATSRFPHVLLARGERDDYYSAERMESDAKALRARNAAVETLTFSGGHEWTEDFRARAAGFLTATSSA